MEEVELSIENENIEDCDNIEELDNSWLEEFENQEKLYKDFYKEQVEDHLALSTCCCSHRFQDGYTMLLLFVAQIDLETYYMHVCMCICVCVYPINRYIDNVCVRVCL